MFVRIHTIYFSFFSFLFSQVFYLFIDLLTFFLFPTYIFPKIHWTKNKVHYYRNGWCCREIPLLYITQRKIDTLNIKDAYSIYLYIFILENNWSTKFLNFFLYLTKKKWRKKVVKVFFRDIYDNIQTFIGKRKSSKLLLT